MNSVVRKVGTPGFVIILADELYGAVSEKIRQIGAIRSKMSFETQRPSFHYDIETLLAGRSSQMPFPK